MRDESTKQAAQEYLAAKLTIEEQMYEDKHNRATAVALSPLVWKSVKGAILAQCSEWNAVTQEETLTCKETPLGDLRIWCAARSKQMTVHYDSRKLLITVKNAGRLEHEKDVILRIEGYRTGADRDDRDARLVRNEQPVNIDMLILAELRVLTGIGRQRNPEGRDRSLFPSDVPCFGEGVLCVLDPLRGRRLAISSSRLRLFSTVHAHRNSNRTGETALASNQPKELLNGITER